MALNLNWRNSLFYKKIAKKSSINWKIEPYKIEPLPNQHKWLEINKKTTPEMGVVCFGTSGRTWTSTLLLETDFESVASTSFATEACDFFARHLQYTDLWWDVKNFF